MCFYLRKPLCNNYKRLAYFSKEYSNKGNAVLEVYSERTLNEKRTKAEAFLNGHYEFIAQIFQCHMQVNLTQKLFSFKCMRYKTKKYVVQEAK